MMERWRDGDEQRFDRDAHRGPNGIASERHVWSHCPLSTERLFQAKGACLTPKHSSSLVGDGR